MLWWLSFADSSLPTGSQFLGACIVEGFDVVSASVVAHAIGCNPGGEVLGVPVPADVEIPNAYLGRLLSRDDCERFDRAVGGDGEAVNLCSGCLCEAAVCKCESEAD